MDKIKQIIEKFEKYTEDGLCIEYVEKYSDNTFSGFKLIKLNLKSNSIITYRMLIF